MVLFRILKRLGLLCLGLMMIGFMAAPPSFAADVYLVARQFDKLMPDGTTVRMWGFASDADNNLNTIGTEAATSPGPMITVQPNDAQLNIHLRNDLSVPVSIVIPGLTAGLSPVRFTDTLGRSRVESFTAETAPGSSRTYTWNNVRTGSLIYHSGTHPALQVQMGLYGGVKKNFAAGQAYSNGGSAFVNEVVLFYSEIDPALHTAVANGTYGTASYPSTINYSPKYFLVNGAPYTTGTPAIPAGNVNENTLIRFYNLGLDSHVPTMLDFYMKLIAEDANLYPFPKQQYSAHLPASKTIDAIFTPTKGGRVALFDRKLSLLNGTASSGGMLSYLNVVGSLLANDDSYSVTQGNSLNVPAPGVLANDSLSGNSTASLVTTVGNGSLTLNADGSFVYTPAPAFSGQVTFSYRIVDGANTSNTATVTITVNPAAVAPIASNDAYSTDEDTQLNIAAAGVLANDTITYPNPAALLVANVRNGTLRLNADGSFTYTPAMNFSGTDSFTYMITTSGLSSNTATVTITVNPVNDSPVARNDSAATFKNDPVMVIVLANDLDPDGDALMVTSATGAANGTLAINPDYTVTYTPNIGYFGPDSFTYTISDGSLTAAATVSMVVNNRPDAANDQYSVNEDTTLNVAAPGVLANDIVNEPSPIAVIVNGPTSGILTLNVNGSFSYTPSPDFNGVDSFTYVVNTATVNSNVAIVTITVNPVNDRPIAAYDVATTPFNTPININVLANDTDVDGDQLSVIINTNPTNGTVVINPDRTVRYTPRAGFSGTDTFYYIASDGLLTSIRSRVTVTVRANATPVAVGDNVVTTINTPITINVVANDYDPDGTIVPSTVTIVSNPIRGGTVVNNGNGTIRFTPGANFIGFDSFYYTVRDNYGRVSNNAKVIVQVIR